MEPLRQPDDGQIVEKGPGGGPVLQEAPPSRQKRVTPAQGLKDFPYLEPGYRIQAVQPLGQRWVIGQNGDGDLLAGGHNPLLNGLKDGVVSRIGETVVTAHHHVIPAPAHLIVHLQAVSRHPAHRVEIKDHLTAVGPQLRLLLRREGQGSQHILPQPLRSGHRQTPATEVARLGLLQLVRAKEPLIALVARHDHRLGGGHGLQSRAGHPHKQIPRRHDLVDIGAGTGHHYAGAAQIRIHLVRLGFDLVKHIAPAGDDQLDARHFPVQIPGNLHQLTGHQSPVLVHPAHIGDHRLLGVQPQLGHHPVPRDLRGELVGVDAVYGDGDVLLRHPILPHQICLDVLGYSHRPLSPVGEIAQHPPSLKDPVGGGDKGEVHSGMKGAAQKGGDAGVGVDHIGPLLPDDLLEELPGATHIPYVPPVHGDRVVPDACRLDLGYIHPSIGGDGHVMALRFQLLGQLHDVSLRSADIQAHGGH